MLWTVQKYKSKSIHAQKLGKEATIMELQAVNDKLLLSSYIYCKALDFELNHPQETLKDRVIYFVGCRAYEAIICFILKKFH